jgi:hypothetical protein
MGICNQMIVSPGDPDGNECILVRYSVDDGAGNPHQHVRAYGLRAEYTPKAVAGAPDEASLALKTSFTGHTDIRGSYAAGAASPTWSVSDETSVIVPKALDGWPPEPSGDTIAPPPCPQYAVEVALHGSVRTVNGWGRLYGWRHVSRHIIVKRT